MQLLIPKNVSELKKTSHSIHDYSNLMDKSLSLNEKASFVELYKDLLSILEEQRLSCSENCEAFAATINEAKNAQEFLEIVVEEMEKFRIKDFPF